MEAAGFQAGFTSAGQSGPDVTESAYGTVQQLARGHAAASTINAKVGSDELYATTPGQTAVRT